MSPMKAPKKTEKQQPKRKPTGALKPGAIYQFLVWVKKQPPTLAKIKQCHKKMSRLENLLRSAAPKCLKRFFANEPRIIVYLLQYGKCYNLYYWRNTCFFHTHCRSIELLEQRLKLLQEAWRAVVNIKIEKGNDWGGENNSDYLKVSFTATRK